VDISHNAFTANLYAFASALSVSPDNSIAAFDASSNQLSGELPSGLSSLALFAQDRPDLTAAFGAPLPRLFNISNNAFSGTFPAWVVAGLPMVLGFCQAAGCAAAVGVAGPDMQLACPAPGSASVRDVAALLGANGSVLECRAAGGGQVQLGPYLRNGSEVVAAPPAAGGRGGGLSAGVVAGAVVGAVACVGLLGALAACLVHRRRRGKRAGRPQFMASGDGAAAPASSAYASASNPRSAVARDVPV
jgi:hypothetical protein